MAYSRNKQNQAREYYVELLRRKAQQDLKEKQQQYGLGNSLNQGVNLYNNTKGVYDTVTGMPNRISGWGSNLSKWGANMSQSQNPQLANAGTKMQNLGTKFQNFASKLKASNAPGASPASTGMLGNTMQGMYGGGTGTGMLSGIGSQGGNMLGGTSQGGVLGNSILSSTGGAGSGAGASGGALGSAIAGQTAGTAGTSAGSGALAGSIGSATGGTAAATGASAGGITAGSAGAAGGAAGAAGGAAAAIPVAGWVIAAAAAAKMIKDKIDAAHKKLNAKAMQADAENMQKSSESSKNVADIARNNLLQDAEAATEAMGSDQGVEGELPDLSQFKSSDELEADILEQLQQPQDTPSNLYDPNTGGMAYINGKPAMVDKFGGQSTGGAAPISNGASIADMFGKYMGGQPTGGAAPVSNTNTKVDPVVLYDDNFTAENQPLKNWDANTWDAIGDAKASGINDGQTLNNMTQGLNSGNKDVAALIDKYSINKPQTQEEIVAAKQGTFNKPQPSATASQPITVSNKGLKEDIMQRIANGIKNFQAGYQDNTNSTFTQGDLYRNAMNKMNPSAQNGVLTGGAAQSNKTFMNRLGELAGTGQRILANPLTQGAIAGTIAGIQDGDIATGLQTAYDWAGKKAKSNAYYKKLHPNSNYIPVFSGDYDANDYRAQSFADYQAAMADIRQQQQDDSHAKDFGKAGDIWAAYAGTDPDYYNEIVNDPNFDANAEISKNDVKNYIEARRKQNKDTFDMGYKNTQSAERSRHNKAMEGIGYSRLGLSQQKYADSKKQREFDNSLKLENSSSKNYATELKNAKTSYEEKSKLIDNLDVTEEERIALQDELAKRYNSKIAGINNKYSTSTNTSTNTSTATKPKKVDGGLAF